MQINLTNTSNKQDLFQNIEKQLIEQGFSFERQDRNRPWGGFFVIEETEAQAFADLYFDGMDVGDLKISGKLSPKILVVAPHTRLSWQYHFRRAEIWRAVQGDVGVITSMNDNEGETMILKPGDTITLKQGERHRLIGLDTWGIVAEIWQHTDVEHPSDEDDIVRLQDDFGR
jgi:mannose-6-phosphate isomerase